METLKRIALDTKFILHFTWYFIIFCVTHIRWMVQQTFSKDSDSFSCLVGKTAIVTGGNSGIGYATSLLLASRGCKVIIACRRNAREEVKAIKESTGNPNIYYAYLDLCSFTIVRSFAENIRKNEPKLDILINNAGALNLNLKVSEDGLNALMQTNYFGPFLLTHLLVEPLKASDSPRIIFVSSALAHVHKLSLDTLNIKDYDNEPATTHMIYANSKVCTILAAQEFSKRLCTYGIEANSADPGISKTSIALGYNLFEGDSTWTSILNFLTSPFMKDPRDAAQTTFYLATSKKTEIETGQHYFRCKKWQKPNILNNKQFVEEIWKESEKLARLNSNERLEPNIINIFD